MKSVIKILLILIFVGMNISCDQITKKEVRGRISDHQIIKVIDSNFILTKVENTGAALSMGENLPPFMKIVFLQILPTLVLVALLFYVMKNPNPPKVQVLAFTFIIGGGIANIIDRIRFNSVTDFMYIEIGPFHTGIFNMADVSVTIGVTTLLLASIIKRKENYGKASI